MNKISVVFLLLLLAHGGLTAQLTVWPGDANNNGVCNHVDLIYMGLGVGNSGSLRDSASNAWTPQNLPTPWNQATAGGLNHGFFDTDGNGLVDYADTLAIHQNYGLTHGTVIPDSSSFSGGGTMVPELLLSFPTDSLSFSNDTTVVLDISLGSPASQVSNILGIAFTLEYDTSVVDQLIPNLTGGWLTQNGFYLQIFQLVENRVEVAITRTDQVAVSGSGYIGSIGIVMDDNLRLASTAQLKFEVTQLIALNATGQVLSVNGSSDSIAVNALTHALPPEGFAEVQIAVNQREGMLYAAGLPRNASLALYNLSGQLVHPRLTSDNGQVRLSMEKLPAGIYLLEVRYQDFIVRKKIPLLRAD